MPDDWTVTDHFLGTIHEDSSDYTDHRYVVRRKSPTWSLEAEAALTLGDDDLELEHNRTVVATNLAEPSTSHTLAEDDAVHVFGVVVTKQDSVTHYYFFRGGGGIIPVQLTTDGGSNGNKTTAASYTYTVKDITGVTTLGTLKSPFYTRQNGLLTGAATRGHIWYESGVLKLYPYEFPSMGACV